MSSAVDRGTNYNRDDNTGEFPAIRDMLWPDDPPGRSGAPIALPAGPHGLASLGRSTPDGAASMTPEDWQHQARRQRASTDSPSGARPSPSPSAGGETGPRHGRPGRPAPDGGATRGAGSTPVRRPAPGARPATGGGPAGGGPGSRRVEAPPDPPPPAAVPTVPDAASVDVSMFGPTSGGKSTYLLALTTGRPDPQRFGTSWRVIPRTDPGRGGVNTLDEEFRECVREHAFPQGTIESAEASWLVEGSYPPAEARRGFRWRRDEPEPIRFALNVVDRPGGDFRAPENGTLARLATSDALVYLVDPLLMLSREGPDGQARPSNYDYVDKLLPYLAGQRLDLPVAPQHLAVCVGKFDDERVYQTARRLGVVDRGPHGQPSVPGGEPARRLFNHFCEYSVEPNDHLIPGLLESHYPRRCLSYHVVSSIGFYVEPGRGFDEGNFGNVVTRSGRDHVRRLAPLNVWEVLLDLYTAVRSTARQPAVRR